MQRYSFLSAVLLFTTFLACNKRSPKPLAQPHKKPNIILILADDQGWGDLGHSGNSNLKTPNIDALAANGVSFDNFFVQPVCSPTRAELLTGRHFTRLGVTSTSEGGERMNLDETTLADILEKAGYATAAYGKWHNGTQPPYHPNSRGFEDFYGFCSGHWGNNFSPMLEHNGEIVTGNGYLADDLTDHGLQFIAQNAHKPFFLYLPYNTPHSPMQVPDAYWDRHKDAVLEKLYPGPEQEDLNFTRAALAMVENIDTNVGRIMMQLRSLNLTENTIVLYLSDNGPNAFRWNGDLRGKKGSTDEGGVRTPFFMQWKDSIPKGKQIPQIASALDILPTLAKLVGVKADTKKAIDGCDLSTLIFNKKPSWEERLIYNHWNGKTSVRSQRFRLDDANRLYDMEQDHGQTKDVSTAYQQITDSLMKAKANWLAETMPIAKEKDDRPFSLGYPGNPLTLLPARDGMPHGNIHRSNKYPNDSFFTNWIDVNDSITWDVEVHAEGSFEVQLYYTCSEKNIGSIVELSLGNSKIATKITKAYNPALGGMEHDRVPRMESYVKEFIPMKLGTMTLKKGRGYLTLKTLEIQGKEAFDMRLLQFKRVQ